MAAEKTLYHVLREVKGREGGPPTYEPVAANVAAHSSDDALKQSVKETDTYVAVPSRSFAPTKVTIETQTVVKVGAATA